MCDTCGKFLLEIDINKLYDIDEDEETEKEELSPYNTPLVKYKEFSACTADSGTTWDEDDGNY